MKRQLLIIALILLPALAVPSAAAVLAGQDDDTYIVLLKEPSVVEKVLELTPGESREIRRQMLFSPTAREYQRSLEESQAQTMEALTAFRGEPGAAGSQASSSTTPRISVLARRSFLLNLMVVRCSRNGLNELRKRPDVKAVYPNRSRKLHMDNVPLLVGATSVWDLLGGLQAAGKDIRVGIIDSGIDRNHPMMSDPTLTPPSGFPKPSEFSAYTNSKIIVARNYVTTQYAYKDQPIHTPQDEMGHGTAVASIAAGAWVNTPYFPIQGMAPKAFLGNYKVFGNPNTENQYSQTAGVVAAINDAVEDQMDVVNLSLGGLAVPAEADAEQLAIAGATEAGVVVVVSAGNAGPRPGTVSSPGNSSSAITVGATTPGRSLNYGMEISSTQAPVPADLSLIVYVPAEGNSHVISTKTGPVPIASIVQYDPTAEGCSPLPPGSFSGKIALMKRGSCTFSDKALNATAAGAEGIVVYQNVDDAPITMSSVQSPPHIAVMIEKSKGEILQTFLASNTANVTLHPQTALFPSLSTKDQLTGFSSRGPEIFSLEVKPDLVAPGQTILAANRNEQAVGGYSPVNGTSFSAPIVSGAAALIQQVHLNNWSPAAVKSSLVNTAEKSTTWQGEAAGVIHTGNGRLNVTKAAGAQAVLDPASISFGVTDRLPGQEIERTINVTNLGSSVQTLSIELVESVPHPSVQLSVSPLALTLGKDEKGKVVVNARIVAPLRYGTFEGFVRLTASGSSSPLTASYWGSISVADSSLVLSVARDGSGTYSSLADAFTAARPGATIEITDSSAYSGEIPLNVNRDGVPLDGLTLRSKKGSSPFLVGDSGGVGLVMSGVRGVTIDGLKLRQGLYSFLSLWSSGRVVNAEIADARYGMWLENSQFAVLDTTIQQVENGLVAVRSGLNLARGAIRDNSGEGIFLQDTPALIQTTSISQNKKQGLIGTYWDLTPGEAALSLFDSTLEKNVATSGIPAGIAVDVSGLFKGNVIKDTTGSTGDGIYAEGPGSSLPTTTFWVQDNQLLNNSRHGLHSVGGAQVSFLRNQVKDNRGLGLYLVSGQGTISSSWFLANGRGIRSESSDLDISNSVIAGSTSSTEGDGIYADQGKLSVRNSTITKNRKGLKLVSVADHLIVNSILNQNGQGDLEGGQQSQVNSNIIGDGTFAGTNGNNQTDPRFTDPVSGDYSLTRTSPAIDAASPDYAVGAVDALSRERSVDGDNDGHARADIGAIEYESKNWVPIILPVLSSRSDEFVGLAMVNTSSETAHVELSGYSVGGSLQGLPYKKDVPAGSQFSILLSEALPTLKQGWVRITTNKPDLMSFSLLGGAGLSQMDGADLSGAISSKLLFPEIRKQVSSDTQLFIVNPNAEQVEVVVRFHTATQNTLLLSQKISPQGAYSRAFSTFGGGSVSGGYVTIEVKEQKPVFAMEIFSNGRSIAGLLGLDMTRPQPTLFGAQLATTASVDTILNVVNVGSAAVDLTVEAFNESGGLVKSVKVSKLAAGQQYRKTATEIFGLSEELVGWARISAKDGKLVGCLSFSDTAGNFMASLPLQSQPAREFVLGHVAQTAEVFTGVTLLNAGAGYAQVSVEVLDRSGVSKGISLFELKPQEKRARLLSEYVPELGQQEGGFVRVRSNSPIFGFELFGHNLLRFMSAVPQQVVVY